MIRILYFAGLRERLGLDEEQCPLPEGVTTVVELILYLRARDGIWGEVFAEDATVMTALNQELVRPDAAIRDGDEVGLFPPVTGG